MISLKLEEEYEVSIGQNAQENWDLISRVSHVSHVSHVSRDIWFHLDGNLSSPHVVLTVPKGPKGSKKVPKRVISECAMLCKEHSKYANIHKVSVIYTELKNVHKGDKVGSVIAKKTSSILV